MSSANQLSRPLIVNLQLNLQRIKSFPTLLTMFEVERARKNGWFWISFRQPHVKCFPSYSDEAASMWKRSENKRWMKSSCLQSNKRWYTEKNQKNRLMKLALGILSTACQLAVKYIIIRKPWVCNFAVDFWECSPTNLCGCVALSSRALSTMNMVHSATVAFFVSPKVNPWLKFSVHTRTRTETIFGSQCSVALHHRRNIPKQKPLERNEKVKLNNNILFSLIVFSLPLFSTARCSLLSWFYVFIGAGPNSRANIATDKWFSRYIDNVILSENGSNGLTFERILFFLLVKCLRVSKTCKCLVEEKNKFLVKFYARFLGFPLEINCCSI